MRWQSMKERAAALAVAALVGSLVVGTVGVGSAAAAVPAAQSTTAFCVNVPAGFGGFTDIAATIHRKTIECLAFAGVTKGVTATTFAPSAPITRGQMASFIARAIDKVNELEKVELPALPASPPNAFADDDGTTHEANINRLAAAGIVSGKSATTFAPNEVVTRGQMATFINNAQKFLSGGKPFTTTEDYFVDDETSVHEANINGIAFAGVTAGVDSTHYAPANPVLRANMATFITRYLAVLHKFAAIDALPPATQSNATIAFTPTTEARITAATEPTTTDERTYTASGLGAGPYRVELFEAAKVTVSTDAVYTFTEDGTSNLAAAGTVGGRIVSVNGLPVTATQAVGAITPVSGSITVSVDAVTFGQLLPVIYPESGATPARLNLDAQNRPSEAFGVGGRLETIPERATTGPLGQDATVLFNDEAADLIVASIGGTERSYLYDSNDSFFKDSVSVSNQMTMAAFEKAVTKGDRLDALTAYQATSGLPSTFVLENVSPAPPTAHVVTPVGEQSAVITIDDLLADATANVYLGADGASFAASPLKTSSAADADQALAGFQVNLTGLTPGTSYEFYVTQTTEGEESAPAFTVAGPQTSLVTSAAAPPTVVGAHANGGRPDSQLLLDFSEAVTPLAGASAKVSVECKTLLGLLTTFTGSGIGAVVQHDADTLLVNLNGTMPAPDALSSCAASVGAGAVQDVSGQQNPAQSGINVP